MDRKEVKGSVGRKICANKPPSGKDLQVTVLWNGLAEAVILLMEF